MRLIFLEKSTLQSSCFNLNKILWSNYPYPLLWQFLNKLLYTS